MYSPNRFRRYFVLLYKKYSTKPVIKLEENVDKMIQNEEIKPRKHPGIVSNKTISVPESIVKAMYHALQDYPIKTLCNDSEALVTYLKHRHAPLEQHEIQKKIKDVEEKFLIEKNDVSEPKEELFKRYRGKLMKMLKTKIHIWNPVNYDAYTSLKYLIGRSAIDYAILMRIFNELATKDPNFKPRSFFDFGSGVGTGTWAVKKFWNDYLFEYFNVDSSADMHDLGDTVLKHAFGQSATKGVFRRQFLPSLNVKYDIVLSAFSLGELPSLKNRIETVLNLWNKTEHYLILVELGNNVGFKMINEVRDFILSLEDSESKGHVSIPCPHDKTCPRVDNTPCNFELNYYTLPFGKSELHKERFSYVVLKKGPRDDRDRQWPRIVRPTLVRSKHTICRLCTASGSLEEVIFTAFKHGKSAYHCARGSRWGDTLPITITKSDTS